MVIDWPLEDDGSLTILDVCLYIVSRNPLGIRQFNGSCLSLGIRWLKLAVHGVS